jgi:polyhydroxyalkanoate synthase
MKLMPPILANTDQSRRWLGQVLDTLGLAPVESPSRVVFKNPCVTLRAYGGHKAAGPILLIVPAPIKRAYIWDLLPAVSVVRQCMRRGLRVYLMQWEAPGEAERDLGLAAYADRLIFECLQAVEAETGESGCFLAGHSLGGTFAAIFAALNPARVKGLILVGTPLNFGPQVGQLDSLVAKAPPAQILTAMLGNVPGSVLNGLSYAAAPMALGWSRLLDAFHSLPVAKALETHLRVERWTLDELPMP